jgi:membrane-associated phospholipid phosphatase/tRNA A-37 threonylcarbamoyl transferase component Bud32
VWLILIGWLLLVNILWSHFPALLRFGNQRDTAVLQVIAHLRTSWLTPVMRVIKAGGSGWIFTILGLGTVVALMVLRRWRHLLAMFGALFVLVLIGNVLYEAASRPRPYGIKITGTWGGFSMPSPPLAALALVLVSLAYTIVIQGRSRWYAKLAVAGILAVVAFSRLYLAVDHPSDVIFGIILGVAIPVTVFRLFTPNEVFPVTYRRGKAAHLDVTGPRGEAIREGIRDQLGLTVLEIKPVGLEGSGGSTPLRLRVAGDPDTYLFAKLYARNHVRADRWYKIIRTIAYGSLEDETSFKTVRRFVEYEDYLLRLMNDVGMPVPAPYGIVEITPEREYMILMEFFEGAEEISDADVDDAIIDSGLSLIRKLWDAGLAHRDVKPANLMVRNDEVLLIDVFFAQVRPSPWRQAVDLGNMMLVLAVRSDTQRVYERALRFFTPDEIAEAFAATRGVASPTQLRSFMDKDPRDLLGEFRRLAPPRPLIAVQRFSVKRIALILAAVVIIVQAIVIVVQVYLPAQNLGVSTSPDCRPNHVTILMAQAVPSAELVPCIESVPSGWMFAGADVHSGSASFWFNSDRAGERAVTVTLTRSCDVAGVQEVPSDEAGALRYERPASLTPVFDEERTYTFDGGCAMYRFDFREGASPNLAFVMDAALTFLQRSALVSSVQDGSGLALCGAGAPECPG